MHILLMGNTHAVYNSIGYLDFIITGSNTF